MSDDITLREKARDFVQAGRIPNRRPDRMWGGLGFGEQCLLCHAPVKYDEFGLEVEFERDDGAGATNHHFHTRCFSALELELRSVELARRRTFFQDQPQSATAAPKNPGIRRQEGTGP